MKTVFEDSFVKILFCEQENLIEVIFKDIEIFEQDFKKSLRHFLKEAEKYLPKKALWDLCYLRFTIVPSLQVWIDQNVNKKEVELGIKKEAFVVSQDFITQLSVEQSMDEEFGKQIQSQYFTNRKEAIEWLLQDDFS